MTDTLTIDQLAARPVPRVRVDLFTERVDTEQDTAAIAVPEGTLVLTSSGTPMRQRVVLRPAGGGPERVLAVSRLQDPVAGVHLLDVALSLLVSERT